MHIYQIKLFNSSLDRLGIIFAVTRSVKNTRCGMNVQKYLQYMKYRHYYMNNLAIETREIFFDGSFQYRINFVSVRLFLLFFWSSSHLLESILLWSHHSTQIGLYEWFNLRIGKYAESDLNFEPCNTNIMWDKICD